MVAITDLTKVNQLYQERSQIGQALAMFDAGGKITALGLSMVNPAFGPMNSPPIVISTGYMEYPPQMVEAIKASLQGRRQEIVSELADLGVSGIEEDTVPSAKKK